MATLEYTNVFDSNYNVDTCSKCGTETYIINKTHYLCNTCNCHRLHGISPAELQKIKQETYRARQLKKAKAKAENAPKGQKTHIPKIRQVSEKQAKINAQMSQMKYNIREEAFNTNQSHCWGCGEVHLNLDCSHIIPIAQRQDLQLDPENINLFCREKCHRNWESWRIEKQIQLNTFLKDIEYIYRNDNKMFQKLFHNLLNHYSKNPYKDVAKLLKKIESFQDIEIEAQKYFQI